ncbi:MAG: hypothetical protein KDA83_15325 [Planctomycetales bacterium]|nr:hypothetical protein [Planctomycetales bacterium]
MASAIVGFLIVVGACVALWWHSGVRDELLKTAASDNEREFLLVQYRRRSWTTTCIGLLGLCILAIEANRSLWGDAILLAITCVLVMVILVRAWSDVLATRRFFRGQDQGVRSAKRALIEELHAIEQRLKDKRTQEAQRESSDSPEDARADSGAAEPERGDSAS